MAAIEQRSTAHCCLVGQLAFTRTGDPRLLIDHLADYVAHDLHYAHSSLPEG